MFVSRCECAQILVLRVSRHITKLLTDFLTTAGEFPRVLHLWQESWEGPNSWRALKDRGWCYWHIHHSISALWIARLYKILGIPLSLIVSWCTLYLAIPYSRMHDFLPTGHLKISKTSKCSMNVSILMSIQPFKTSSWHFFALWFGLIGCTKTFLKGFSPPTEVIYPTQNAIKTRVLSAHVSESSAFIAMTPSNTSIL